MIGITGCCRAVSCRRLLLATVSALDGNIHMCFSSRSGCRPLITTTTSYVYNNNKNKAKAKWNWAKAVASMRRPRIQLQAWADDGPACNKQLPMSKRQWISCRETSYSRQPSATKYTTALQHWSPRKFHHASAPKCGTDMFIWSTMSTQHKHTDQILYSRQTRWGETSYRVYHAPTLGRGHSEPRIGHPIRTL